MAKRTQKRLKTKAPQEPVIPTRDKDIPVSKEVVRLYMLCLELTNDKLAHEAEKIRIREREEQKKQIQKTGGVDKKEDRLKDTGPGTATIKRMFKDGNATIDVARVVLIALRELTEKAHSNRKSPLNPYNLPTPISLTMHPDEIIRRNNTPLAMNPPGYDGVSFNKRHLTLFEMIYELGQSMRESDSPKSFYAAIHTGAVLRFLLGGIADLEKRIIDTFMIRMQCSISGVDESQIEREKETQCRIICEFFDVLDDSNFREHNRWKFAPRFYGDEMPLINAYMYGEHVIYLRENPYVFGHYADNKRLSQIGARCIRLTEQDEDPYEFNKYYRFLVYGDDLPTERGD